MAERILIQPRWPATCALYLTGFFLGQCADVIFVQLLSASLEEEDPTVYNILQKVH
jgi:hypothetical protein